VKQQISLLSCAGAALIAIGSTAAAQTGSAMTESEQIAEGEAIFHLYCSPCHGRDARGDGPVAADLKTEPPSLREIGKRRGGNFNAGEIRAYIDGRDMPRAHGTPEMPIWGNLFRYIAEVSDTLASDQQAIEHRTEERISLLVKYLQTIQDR
jgi:mono/diheme cytochrome c family protein